MNSAPLKKISHPDMGETLKTTAGRLIPDLEMGLYHLALIKMSKDPSVERENLIKVGAMAHKMVRDIEDALKRPL
jgi:hypothetical protein